MERILIVSVNWLGDAIMLTPACKALKKNIPLAYIGIMANKRVADVFKENPYVDEIILFDERVEQRSLAAKLVFLKKLSSKKFDTVFLVQRSFTRALLCMLAGIQQRIGYARFKNLFVVNKRITQRKAALHRQDRYLYLFEKMGIVIEDRYPQVFVSNSDRLQAQNLAHLGSRYLYIIGVNPSANWSLKRWPENSFAQLCDHLIDRLGCAIVLVGAAPDKCVVDSLMSRVGKHVYDYCGKTTINELAALIEECDVFISNDSGPAHLAAALGVNTLVLFGPTSAAQTAPRGRRVKIISGHSGCVVPCYNQRCVDNRCMRAIAVEDVYTEVKAMLLQA